MNRSMARPWRWWSGLPLTERILSLLLALAFTGVAVWMVALDYLGEPATAANPYLWDGESPVSVVGPGDEERSCRLKTTDGVEVIHFVPQDRATDGISTTSSTLDRTGRPTEITCDASRVIGGPTAAVLMFCPLLMPLGIAFGIAWAGVALRRRLKRGDGYGKPGQNMLAGEGLP